MVRDGMGQCHMHERQHSDERSRNEENPSASFEIWSPTQTQPQPITKPQHISPDELGLEIVVEERLEATDGAAFAREREALVKGVRDEHIVERGADAELDLW